MTGIGIIPDDYYWNVAGVPLLAGQVWLAVTVALVGWFLSKRFFSGKIATLNYLSFVTFIGIWVIAAIVWIRTPLAPSF